MHQPNPAVLSEGSIFNGRYRIVRCISTGGMGAVYECVHLKTDKHRALKVMLPQVIARPGMRDRFELEARVTARIESDHIVETFDAGVDEGSGAPFLVMELLRGYDLETAVQQNGPFSPEDAVALLGQVAVALEKTHAAGIIHRDLKPQNLFYTTRDDGSPRVKILDFGIAKVVAEGAQSGHQTAAIGTPLYMAPEQVTGEGVIGPQADLYAFGHIAYSLLTAKPYWAEEEQGLPVYTFLGRVLGGASEPPTARAARHGVQLPPGFDAWFARSTARYPVQRFDRASTQVRELAAALGVRPPPMSIAPSQPVPGSSNPDIARTPSNPSQPSKPPSYPNVHGVPAATPGPIAYPTPPTPAPYTVPLTSPAPTYPSAPPVPSQPAVPPKRSGSSFGAILGAVVGVGIIAAAVGVFAARSRHRPSEPAPTATTEATAAARSWALA